MFTGLIREMAEAVSFNNNTLRLRAKYKAQIGDSIAVNGACLTVVKVYDDGFSVELSPESQKILAIQNYRGKVHIEPAMSMGDKFEGHIVQGHIDTVGSIQKIIASDNSYDFYVKIDERFISFVVPKGSITIDGVSLTVNEVFKDSFRLTVIPHTMKNTLFATYKTGSTVNIETDMFARYVAHIIKHQQKAVSWAEVDKISALY